MIHELLLSLTETSSGSHPCCVVSVTYHRPSFTASRNFVAELIRCANDHSPMFTFAFWSWFLPPEFPNVWSLLSFSSNHASVLHGFSFLCLKCG
jgi:hypothetical protein